MNSSDSIQQHSILNKLYLEAADELLAALGMEAHLVGESNAGTCMRGYISVLGATGEGIGISSMLNIDRDLLIGVHPLDSASILQRELEDWCRELNNQLVGRMKNKLLNYGISVTLGLPVLLTGTDVTAVATPELTVHEHPFQSARGRMTLSLATRIDEDMELHKGEFSTECDGALLEGAVALF